MYKIAKIKYVSLMVTDGDKERHEEKKIGTIEMISDGRTIYFESDRKYEIYHNVSELVLKQNDSTLKFKLGQKIECDYVTEYGIMKFTTFLETLQENDTLLKAKYHLYQADELVSTIYMQVSWLNIEE